MVPLILNRTTLFQPAEKAFVQTINPSTPLISQPLEKFIGTIHASKGLEATHVFVYDWIPRFEAIEKIELKIGYVGITRAVENLSVIALEDEPGILQTTIEGGA